MSIVANQKTLERGLRAAFVKAFNNYENPSDVFPFIMETTSDGRDEEYGWLGQSPSMSEWVDERKLKALNSFEYKLTNKSYEATLAVKRDDMEDDRLNAVKIRVDDLARKAKQSHPRKLFFDAVINGTTDLCYDGQPFFSASHSEGKSGVQSNIVTGTGTSLDQLSTDLETCEARMLSYKDDIGEPFNEGSVTISVIVPVQLKAKFEKLNSLSYIGVNTENTWKGRIKVITSSQRLTDANDWYFADSTPGLKPMIRQIRQAVKFESQENQSDDGFNRKIFKYGVDSREVFGYGLWQKMIKVTNT